MARIQNEGCFCIGWHSIVVEAIEDTLHSTVKNKTKQFLEPKWLNVSLFWGCNKRIQHCFRMVEVFSFHPLLRDALGQAAPLSEAAQVILLQDGLSHFDNWPSVAFPLLSSQLRFWGLFLISGPEWKPSWRSLITMKGIKEYSLGCDWGLSQGRAE